MEYLHRAKAFLLINTGWKQIVVKNTIWASTAEGVVRILKLALILLLVRYFGPLEYGKFAFAFSFAATFGIIFDAGLVLTATREFSRNKENEELLPDLVLIKLILGLAGMLIISLGMLWLTEDVNVRWMILVFAAYLFASEFINLSYAIFRARQRMEYECYIRICQVLILLAAVGLVMWKAPSVLNASFAYLGSGLLTLGLVVGTLWQGEGKLRFQLRWDVWRRLFRIALPLGMAGGVGALYMNIDSVMLGYWGQITETGWYNVAAKANGVVLVPMSLLSLTTFPAFVSTAGSVDSKFKRRWDIWAGGMIALGSFFACVVLATANEIVELAFGELFRPAALTLQILIITAALIYIYTPCYQALVMFDRQNTLFWALSSGAVINVILNAALIPHYSLYGAAWATVATHIVILCELYFLTARYTPITPINGALFGAVSFSAVSGTLAYLAMKWTGGSLWLSTPIGAVVFLGCFIGLKRAVEMMAARWRLSSAQRA